MEGLRQTEREQRMELNKIYCGDCLSILKTFPDNSIDLTITSPPYDNLRDYKGYGFDFENIAKELYRVTKTGGVVVWVVGDSTIDGSETGTSFRQALYFRKIGFKLHDTMIYEKDPRYPDDFRYLQCFEYMFVFLKGHMNTFNPIIDLNNTTYSTKRKSYNRNKDGSVDISKELTIKEKCKRLNIWFYSAGFGRSTKDKYAFQHPAIFPEKLAEDHILSWSNENDIVLDPMCGSGTTCKMAVKNNRQYIGIEISPEYCKIAQERIDKEKNQLKMKL